MSTIVSVHPPSNQLALVRLNLTDNLSKIRIELKNNRKINMNDALSFAKKVRQTNNNDKFSEITHEDEIKFCLSEITETIGKNNILYLMESSKPIWEFFNDKCKLDYGRTMTNDGIKEAENRAFVMNNCDWKKIGAEGCRDGEVEFNSNKVEDWMMKTNLFFSTDDNIQNFVKLGLSVGTLKAEGFQSEASLSYRYTNYGKLSMKFRRYLKPTSEFINEVEDAIKSEDPENFILITEKFGQFIPSEVILGGRVHFENYRESTEYSAENSMSFGLSAPSTGITSDFIHARGNSKNLKFNYKKLIGGEQPENFENFNETAEKSWIKSLKDDYKNWDCIEFKNPISIFQLLPDNLRKEIFLLVGKKILYLDTINSDFRLNENGEPNIVELKMPLNISKIIQNEDADCSIFAAVVDTKKSRYDFFNCQIFCQPPNGKPSLIIHCIQKKFRKREYKLKIGIMVIGYDADFKDFNAQFDILKHDYSNGLISSHLPSNAASSSTTTPCSLSTSMFKREILNYEYNPLTRKVLCLGIPVLKKLDSSNSSIIIGHHFFHAQEANKIGACTFSYCSKNNYCADLPDFSFYTLVISNYSFSNAFCTIPFNNKQYIDFKKNTQSNLNPKYISLFFTSEASGNNYNPIFLKQKIDQIKIKYPNCKKRDHCICKSNEKIQKNIECVLFDPCTRN